MTSKSTSPAVCKDCRAVNDEINAGGHVTITQTVWRPAPHPGPRCATHHRAKRKQDLEKQRDRNAVMRFGEGADKWYPRMLAFQKGTCAICQRAKGISKRLATDHDHKLEGTGEDPKRGLLCGQCNSMLAHAHDDPAMFERAVRYLKSPPARLMKFLEENNE